MQRWVSGTYTFVLLGWTAERSEVRPSRHSHRGDRRQSLWTGHFLWRIREALSGTRDIYGAASRRWATIRFCGVSAPLQQPQVCRSLTGAKYAILPNLDVIGAILVGQNDYSNYTGMTAKAIAPFALRTKPSWRHDHRRAGNGQSSSRARRKGVGDARLAPAEAPRRLWRRDVLARSRAVSRTASSILRTSIRRRTALDVLTDAPSARTAPGPRAGAFVCAGPRRFGRHRES